MSEKLKLDSDYFRDEDKAREILESIRWPDGPVCPHCGAEGAYRLKSPKKDPAKPKQRPVRPGTLKCKSCRKQFTVKVGTIFSDSKVPLKTWLMAVYLMCASKKGYSAHQLHRTLGVTYKTAWFMAHRIRHAMKDHPVVGDLLSGIVEVDETYVGGKQKGEYKYGKKSNKTPVVSLVERDGRVRSFVMDRVSAGNLKAVINENVKRDARVMTDSSVLYRYWMQREGRKHETVNHFKGEYSRGDVTTNTVEGYFSLLKRGVNGTFHHVSKHHLHRYVSEFDFRYNARTIDDSDPNRFSVAGYRRKETEV